MNRRSPRVLVALAIASLCLLSVRVRAEDHKGHDHRPRIKVKGMSSAAEATAAADELMKVKGVGKVTSNVKTGTLTIEPDPYKAPSPKAMWEATERAKLKVIQLTMDHDKYDSKPKK